MTDGGKFSLFSPIVFVPSLVLLVGVICGSIRAGGIDSSASEEVAGYLGSFFGEVPRGGGELFISSAKKLLALWVLITVSGCFLPGFFLNMYIMAQRGFAIGYTSGCFFGVYGIKGIMACISLVPEMLVFLPALIYFSSISLKMSFSAYDNKKVFLRKFILISLIFLTVFCVVCVFQTFVTTIFMRCISAWM